MDWTNLSGQPRRDNESDGSQPQLRPVSGPVRDWTTDGADPLQGAPGSTTTECPDGGVDWTVASDSDDGDEFVDDLRDRDARQAGLRSGRGGRDFAPGRLSGIVTTKRVVAAVVVVGAAAAVAAGVWASGLTRDIDPVAAAPDTPAVGAPKPSPAPMTTARPRPATDPDSRKTVVAGGCHRSEDQGVAEPGQKNLRSAIVSFETEYFANNPSAIPDLLDDSSSMLLPKPDRAGLGDKAGDPEAVKAAAVGHWRDVLNQIPAGSTWCLTMSPQSLNRVEASLEVTGAGKTTTYRQVIDGVRGGDGKWRIKEITAAPDG